MRVPTHAEPRALAHTNLPKNQIPGLPAIESSVARGTITVISGCMFSGKTTELLRRLADYPESRTLALKHVIDTRYSATQIVSHAGKACPATPVTEAREIVGHLPDNAEIVAIDEAHFFDETVADSTKWLADRGIDVILTALEPDSWGRPFPLGERLRLIADEAITLFATCARCGEKADRTQRLTPISDGQMVGGAECSEPRCQRCWSPPPQPPPARFPPVG